MAQSDRMRVARRALFLTAWMVAVFLGNGLRAAEYYVATSGSDTNEGSLARPWKTIQKAADRLQPGDTVYVRRGTYKGPVTAHVSGSAAGGYITFANYGKEMPVIEGRGFTPPEEETALFYIKDRSYLVVKGFTLRNYRTKESGPVPAGIFVTGASHHIELRNNRIYGIVTTHRDGNALGIAAYGTSSAQAIDHLVIDGNDVHHLRTGSSESIVLNGNVTNFEVTNNRVHHNNNIGIDFAGFEGTCPVESLDRARDGVCRGNIVWNISSRPNPAYHGIFAADGIYCDGATRVLIERNVVYASDIGVELASEHGGKNCTEIVVRDNFIYRNRVMGLALGGYDADRGSTSLCQIKNNTFYQNDTRRTGSGEIQIQFYVSNCVFAQNVLVAGSQRLFIGNQTTSNTSNTFDYNLYFARRGEADGVWEWRQESLEGFAAWKNGSGQDAHSLFADPRFVSAGRGNLRLKPLSPAIDAGDPAFVPAAGEGDIDGQARVVGARVDVGADEWAAP